MIAFVASNPSNLGPDSPAKKNLFKWVRAMKVSQGYAFFNVSNEPTPSNRPLKRSEFQLGRLMKDLTGAKRVVALGETASIALNKLGVAHFKLPHPSPKNRVLNDKNHVEALLRDCAKYLETWYHVDGSE